MPAAAEPITALPSDIDGNYLSLSFDENEVRGTFHTIETASQQEITHYEQDVTFIESEGWDTLGLPPIDTVWFKDQEIHVLMGDSLRILGTYDTVASDARKVFSKIDLAKNECLSWEGDTMKCIVQEHDDAYYINVERFDGLYDLTQVRFDSLGIQVKMLVADIYDSTSSAYDLLTKYNLTPHKQHLEKGYMLHHTTSLSDAELFQLMEEKHFTTWRWHKVEDDSTVMWIVLGTVLTLLSFFVIKEIRS